MQFLFRKPSMPDAEADAPRPRRSPIFRRRHARRQRPPDHRRPTPTASRSPTSRMGCFWGAEKVFWSIPGVWVTAVGYQGGTTPNATYKEACTGKTGHAEAVRVVFDPSVVSYERCSSFLGGPRPDPGLPPGQRRRHPVPLGDLHPRPGAARAGRGVARHVPGGS